MVFQLDLYTQSVKTNAQMMSVYHFKKKDGHHQHNYLETSMLYRVMEQPTQEEWINHLGEWEEIWLMD